MRRFKVIDWKFWLAFALALCVAYLAFIGYSAVQDGREKDRQINALIRTAENKDQAAARRDAAAAMDRQASAANQAALLDYTRALADRQAAIVTYLRDHGIELPVRFVRVIPAPKVANSGTGAKKQPRAHGPTRRSTAPAPDRPGKSEHAPGHKKKGKRR